MNFIDTHSHLYLSDYNTDRSETLNRAICNGVDKILMPNLDLATLAPMLELCSSFPENCFPMIGLHPTSVREDYAYHLDNLYSNIHCSKFISIGEIGIDLYWDSKYLSQQQDAFSRQIDWAIELSLPLVIHCRESFDQIIKILKDKVSKNKISGVFHSFSGTVYQAKTVIDLGFMIGINGIVTFKNSNLGEVVREIPLNKILLETDAPYLAPVPHRGKRNESSFIPLIARKIAEIQNIDIEVIANVTTLSAINLFNVC
jgi:TatD DNase family protein